MTVEEIFVSPELATAPRMFAISASRPRRIPAFTDPPTIVDRPCCRAKDLGQSRLQSRAARHTSRGHALWLAAFFSRGVGAVELLEACERSV